MRRCKLPSNNNLRKKKNRILLMPIWLVINKWSKLISCLETKQNRPFCVSQRSIISWSLLMALVRKTIEAMRSYINHPSQQNNVCKLITCSILILMGRRSWQVTKLRLIRITSTTDLQKWTLEAILLKKQNNWHSKDPERLAKSRGLQPSKSETQIRDSSVRISKLTVHMGELKSVRLWLTISLQLSQLYRPVS